jgi:tRNA A37 threonylcarbamoyladenosine dehydratase
MSLRPARLTAPPAIGPADELIAVPEQEEFYASFTVRNRGLVSDGEQQMLRRAVILVAGCGSIGGAVV